MTPTDDAALVRGVADGDARSLAALYDRHAGRVYSLVVAMVGGAADAEEVTEDVFIQIWETADRFDPARGAVTSWITTVARTRGLDHLRARRRRAQRLERSAAGEPGGTAVAMGAAGPDPWTHTEQEALARRLGDALDRLPE
ncbi:MAG: sigma-70 family RNA polymerase sigma factor, partial [Longimicrobiales bacterium]